MHRTQFTPLERLRLVDERGCAAMLGISVSTLRHWRMRNIGPPWKKIGRAVRYVLGTVEDYMFDRLRHRLPPKPAPPPPLVKKKPPAQAGLQARSTAAGRRR